MKTWKVKFFGARLALLTGLAALLCFEAPTISSFLLTFSWMYQANFPGRKTNRWERGVLYVLLGVFGLFWIYLLWRGAKPLPDWVIICWQPVAEIVVFPLLTYAVWQDYIAHSKAYRSPRAV